MCVSAFLSGGAVSLLHCNDVMPVVGVWTFIDPATGESAVCGGPKGFISRRPVNRKSQRATNLSFVT